MAISNPGAVVVCAFYEWLREPRSFRWFTAQRYGLSFFGVVLLILGFAIAPRNWLAVLATAAVSLALVFCALCSRLEPDKYPNRSTRLVFFLTAAMSGTVVLAIGMAVGRGIAFVGITILYLDAAHLLDLQRKMPADEDPASTTKRLGILALYVAIAAASVFAFGCWLALTSLAPALALTLLASAILAAPVAVALASEWELRRLASKCKPVSTVALISASIVGLVFLVGGVQLAAPAGTPVSWRLGVPLGALILIGFMVGNTPVDVMAFLAAIVVVLGFSMSATTPLERSMVPNGDKPWILAIGDSYMSGEGARRFYDDTNTKDRNECRRAPTAYPALIAQQGKYDVLFLACSGATTKDLLLTPQYPEEPPFDSPIRDLGQITDSLEYRWRTPAGLTQLETAQQVSTAISNTSNDSRHTQPEIVLVSIGGNDAGFGDIAAACVLPGDCSELGESFLSRLPRVYESIGHVYKSIRSKFPNSNNIVAIPYPIPLAANGCWESPLLDTEHAFLRHFTRKLNQSIKESAKDAGIKYLGAAEHVFEDHDLQICDSSAGSSKAGVNVFALNPKVGDFDQLANVSNWFHNSLHPNATGHEVLRDLVLSDVVSGSVGKTDSDPKVKNESDEAFKHHPRQCAPRKTGDYAYCSPPGGGWVLDQLIMALTRSIPALALIVAGGWLICMPIVYLIRRRFGDQRVNGNDGEPPD